jgi:pyrroline-5-carboxylate reductase
VIKVGFIGYGSMGSMLLNGFLTSGRLKPEEIILSTRTKSKLDTVKAAWNGIHTAKDNVEAVQKAKCIFICVKPLEVKGVLCEIKEHLTCDSHIVSIAGSVLIERMEELADCRITKLIPSLTSEVKGGISLVCHNKKVTAEAAAFLEYLLGAISTVKVIEEGCMALATEFTSCAPGLIAGIFNEFVAAGIRHGSGISREDAEEMVVRTLLGTARLFIEKSMGFEETISRVATKGGLTEEGVRVLKSGLPEVFDEMFETMLSKRIKTVEAANKTFLED